MELVGILKENKQIYYLELIPLDNKTKVKEIEKQISKLQALGANMSAIDMKTLYKNIKRFFVGKYKDGSDIPTPYTDKSELFNNQYDTKATIFTKEEAEKRKAFIDKYVKDWIVNIKTV
jgi:hypothetical protein